LLSPYLDAIYENNIQLVAKHIKMAAFRHLLSAINKGVFNAAQ